MDQSQGELFQDLQIDLFGTQVRQLKAHGGGGSLPYVIPVLETEFGGQSFHVTPFGKRGAELLQLVWFQRPLAGGMLIRNHYGSRLIGVRPGARHMSGGGSADPAALRGVVWIALERWGPAALWANRGVGWGARWTGQPGL